MPKIAAQKSPPATTKRTSLAHDPRPSCRSRASAPRHLGVSRVQMPGCTRGCSTSALQYGVEPMLAVTAGELEEEVLQAHVTRLGLLPQLGHGPLRRDPAAIDDGDLVADDVGDLEGVGADSH